MIHFGSKKPLLLKPFTPTSQLSISTHQPSPPPYPHLLSKTSSVIHFGTKRKLNLLSKTVDVDEKKGNAVEVKKAEPNGKETRKEVTTKQSPKNESKNKTLYDSITTRLIRVIDQWIVDVNAQLITNIVRDIQSPIRSCDVFCLIGPSGCGKSVLIKHIMGILQSQTRYGWMIYDDFADIGAMKEDGREGKERGQGKEKPGKEKHGSKGFLSTLNRDSNPFVLIVDGPDMECQAHFQRLLVREYDAYQSYRQPNKSIVLLIQSLNSFVLRDWVRTIGAYKYYLSSTIKFREQEFLRQKIHSVCPLRSMEPIQEFAGDFRRMGIDLIACTYEGVEYHKNTNTVDRVPSIFELTRHLVSWPVEPLYRRLICGDNLDQLLTMCSSNQLKRCDGRQPKAFDELVQLTQELSDIQMMPTTEDMDRSMILYPNSKHINKSDLTSLGLDPWSQQSLNKPFVDCNRYDISSLVYSMYRSNTRLHAQLRPQPVEFARSMHQKKQMWSNLDDLMLDRFPTVSMSPDLK